MSKLLTTERLAELRRIAEAAVPGKWSGQDFQLAMTPRTALALLDEIERLRREREVLAAGLIDSEECMKVLLDLFPDDVRPGVAGVVDRMGRRRRTALALLEGGGGA